MSHHSCSICTVPSKKKTLIFFLKLAYTDKYFIYRWLISNVHKRVTAQVICKIINANVRVKLHENDTMHLVVEKFILWTGHVRQRSWSPWLFVVKSSIHGMKEEGTNSHWPYLREHHKSRIIFLLFFDWLLWLPWHYIPMTRNC